MRESFQKVGYILFPVLLFYLMQDFIQIVGIFAVDLLMQWRSELETMFQAHTATVNLVVHGCSNLIAALSLIYFYKCTPKMQPKLSEKCAFKWKALCEMGLWGLGSGVLALFFNWLFWTVGFTSSSATYNTVAKNQYSVPLLLGIIMYGVIAPIGEELLFRGILQRRIGVYFGPYMGILLAAVFFGIFHGNIVQAIYGSLMGIYLGICYYRTGKFYMPVICHGIANLVIWL